MLYCNVCSLEFKSQNTLDKHYLTSKHLNNQLIFDLNKKVAELEDEKSRLSSSIDIYKNQTDKLIRSLKENEKNLHITKLENESLKSKIKEDGEFKERKIKDNTLLGYLFASAFPLALLSHAVKMKAP